MKTLFKSYAILLGLTASVSLATAQSATPKNFPPGTTVYENIPYANDTLKKHQLDIYLPAVRKIGFPVIVWIHGGAWMVNDKYADMSYMVNTLKDFMDNGYAQ